MTSLFPTPHTHIAKPEIKENQVSARIKSPTKLIKAELHYSPEKLGFFNRQDAKVAKVYWV